MSAQNLLPGQTIIVTGAATGIGQAFALGAAIQGAHVIVADMNSADETMDQIAQAGGKATAVRVDVSDDASVRSMADAALKATGRIDGLINNAAYFREIRLTAFEDLDPEQWERIFQVNVKGVWLCSKAVMPAMRERLGVNHQHCLSGRGGGSARLPALRRYEGRGAGNDQRSGERMRQGWRPVQCDRPRVCDHRCHAQPPCRVATKFFESAGDFSRAKARRPGRHRAVSPV